MEGEEAVLKKKVGKSPMNEFQALWGVNSHSPSTSDYAGNSYSKQLVDEPEL